MMALLDRQPYGSQWCIRFRDREAVVSGRNPVKDCRSLPGQVRGLLAATGQEIEANPIGGQPSTSADRYSKLAHLILNRLYLHGDFKPPHLLFHLKDRRAGCFLFAPDTRQSWDFDYLPRRAHELQYAARQANDHVKEAFLLGGLWDQGHGLRDQSLRHCFFLFSQHRAISGRKIVEASRALGQMGLGLFTYCRRKTTRQIACQRFFVWTACSSVSGLLGDEIG